MLSFNEWVTSLNVKMEEKKNDIYFFDNLISLSLSVYWSLTKEGNKFINLISNFFSKSNYEENVCFPVSNRQHMFE